MSLRIPIILILALAFLMYQCGREGNDKQKQNAKIANSQDRPNNIITARTLGLAYLEENKLNEAKAEFLKLISLAPEEANGYANLGLVFLRMGDYPEAEEQLRKAIQLDPQDPNIRLNLAKVYELNNEPEKSIQELEKTLEVAPGHVQTLFSIAEYYGGSDDKQSMVQREEYLKKVVQAVPANVVPRLNLIEILLRNGKNDEALANLEEIQRLNPEFPSEASEYYIKALESLQTSKSEEVLTNVLIFHNYLKLTNSYQSGVDELKGSRNSSMGVPVFTFNKTSRILMPEGKSILDAIRFTDVSSSAGLDIAQSVKPSSNENIKLTSHISIADFDRNGENDLYLGSYSSQESKYNHFLFKSNMGRFSDVSAETGIQHSGLESSSIFADYDNDGFLDLFIVKEDGNLLYKNVSEGIFQDVSKESKVEDAGSGSMALFVDMDHEGDLDIFIAKNGANWLFRNNGDGTFTEQAVQSGIAGENVNSRDACFGDFDDDGDIDLFLVNQDASNVLYTNLREGKFKDITSESGLESKGGSGAVVAGDYNNDGFLDLFVTGLGNGSYKLYKNKGNGTFENDKQSSSTFKVLENVIGYDVSFFDFDNDGYQDLLIAGESKLENGKGVFLFHNDGTGKFEDSSNLLPEDLLSGHQIGLADYNKDGDQDIFITGLYGGVRLLRNDGGNTNQSLNIQLIGIRTGSGKNNYFGIGAKVEVRADDLYQMKVITEPAVQFGLANRTSADVVRILWTNGTPQNIFSPGSDQDLIEEQQLKGSCPFLYTWNGTEYTFVKDIMWRSALGMPLGIMGGNTAYAFANASEEYLKIPGEFLVPKNGKYSLQVTEELWETIYFDELQLIALDHPDSVEVYVDERFSPPPYPEHRVYSVSKKHFPISVEDGQGNDLLPFIIEKDNNYISNFKKTEYQGLTEMRELILDPGTLSQTGNLQLFLNGWIFPTDASINMAISQSEKTKVVPPYLQVINDAGQWETIIENLGFPEGKNKTIIADLSGAFLSKDHKVRICTNMEIYWDYIFFSESIPDATLHSKKLIPVKADHHYRGFSRLYRKGGRYGPHWFDYKNVSTDQKWRDLTGNYTRYGDVRELLLDSDDKYIIANAGDETTIEFDATNVKDLPFGWKRDFLIYSVGWVKDGDLNTANGQTVGPLPFHGMTKYPYKNESYPTDKEHQEYLQKYNTRVVTTDEFKRALVDSK
ncbi:MAG: FG-GAP-like repeat-containing protein [Bacteroidales bacterium]|nr:FG-GAP-like repeat-containing protein [Bacteroidales bacterium]